MTSRQILLARIFAIGGMMLVIATHLVRPILGMFPEEVAFVFGVLPNFGAGLSLPFLLVMLMMIFWRLELKSVKFTALFVSSLIITFLALAAWEIIQFKVWGFPMDRNDILATGLSEFCAAGGYFVLRKQPGNC
jgi:hypothetical protein